MLCRSSVDGLCRCNKHGEGLVLSDTLKWCVKKDHSSSFRDLF